VNRILQQLFGDAPLPPARDSSLPENCMRLPLDRVEAIKRARGRKRKRGSRLSTCPNIHNAMKDILMLLQP